jgi:trehalose 6-phosphate phosphatase
MLRPLAATEDALVERLASAPEKTGLFLDFDGVLAPIVARPEDATAPPETRAELERLVGRYRIVCVVTGRTGDDVRSRVGVAGVVYVGSHGLELDPDADLWRGRIHAFTRAVRWPPAQTEDKGLSVSFHYRDRTDEEAVLAELDAIAGQARADGLVARFGRKLLEVLPPLDSNKGTAVRQLLHEAGLARALVAGDDTTDLDSFGAVADLELGVRVAVASPESPSQLREHADIVVESTGEFLELLRKL